MKLLSSCNCHVVEVVNLIKKVMPEIYSGDKFGVVALLGFLNQIHTHNYVYGSAGRGKKVKNVET